MAMSRRLTSLASRLLRPSRCGLQALPQHDAAAQIDCTFTQFRPVTERVATGNMDSASTVSHWRHTLIFSRLIGTHSFSPSSLLAEAGAADASPGSAPPPYVPASISPTRSSILSTAAVGDSSTEVRFVRSVLAGLKQVGLAIACLLRTIVVPLRSTFETGS